MKILLITASYPPVLGGLQTVVSKLAGEFKARGHAVRVITNHYPRSLSRREVLNGIEVVREQFMTPSFQDVNRGRFDLFAASLWYSPYTSYRLEQEWKAFQPDVVNFHFPDAQIPFVLRIKEKLATRVVTSLHGNEIERWFQTESSSMCNNERSRNLLRKTLQESDSVTACSKYLLELAIQVEPSISEKIHVIHNGVDLARFRNKLSYHYPKPYIFSCGRLTTVKGFDILLKAFTQICKYQKNIDLIIAGEGPEAENLKAQVAQSGITDRVVFLGRAAPDDIVKLINGCLFVVIPSRQETFGIVGLEARAAGKPVIASNLGGLPEIITGDGTLLVEPDANQFAQAITQWLECPPILPRSDQPFVTRDWSTVADDYERILKG